MLIFRNTKQIRSRVTLFRNLNLFGFEKKSYPTTIPHLSFDQNLHRHTRSLIWVLLKRLKTSFFSVSDSQCVFLLLRRVILERNLVSVFSAWKVELQFDSKTRRNYFKRISRTKSRISDFWETKLILLLAKNKVIRTLKKLVAPPPRRLGVTNESCYFVWSILIRDEIFHQIRKRTQSEIL